MKTRFSTYTPHVCRALCMMALCGLTWACKDDYTLDDEKPDWLYENIYSLLEKEGTYNNYLRLLEDKDINTEGARDLKEVLSKTGSKTVFVANDDAWNQFVESLETSLTAFIASGMSTRTVGDGRTNMEQGTWWAGKRGPNLLSGGSDAFGGWASGVDNSEFKADSACRYELQDIFDIDMGILYGCDVFPLSGDWQRYEGWIADNMTLVMGHLTANWGDVYGFDIPLNIGDHIAKNTMKTLSDGTPVTTPALPPTGSVVADFLVTFVQQEFGDEDYTTAEVDSDGGIANVEVSGTKLGESNNEGLFQPGVSYYSYHLYNLTLSTEDIDKIDEALQKQYGSSYDIHRQEQVRTALALIGRGFAEQYMGRAMYQFKDDGTGTMAYSKDDITHSHDFWTKADIPSKNITGSAIEPLFGDGTSRKPLRLTCSCGNESSLPSYLRALSGYPTGGSPRNYEIEYADCSEKVFNSYSNCLPGDYLVVNKPMSVDDMPVGQTRIGEDDAGEPIYAPVYDVETLRYYSADKHYAVFIGCLDTPLTLSSGQYIGGKTIEGDSIPIYIDMSTLSKYTMYNRGLEYLQKVSADAADTIINFIDVEVDPDASEVDEYNKLAQETTYGVMKYMNGGRMIGGIYLHGEAGSKGSMWIRKNRTIDAWAADPLANDVRVVKFEYLKADTETDTETPSM